MRSTIYRRGRGGLKLLAMILEWHIGDVVRKLREVRGYKNQESLGEAAGGLNKSTINRLETRGEIGSSPETIRAVARVLEIPVSELYALVPQATGSAPVTDESRERDVLWERLPAGPTRQTALATLRRLADIAAQGAEVQRPNRPQPHVTPEKEKGIRRSGKRA